MTPAPIKAGPFLRSQSRNSTIPGWLRVTLWCWGNANTHGHARTYPDQLRRDLQLGTSREVSRCLRLARERGLIDSSSTAACVVLPGHYLAPCEANHREVTHG